MQKLGEEQEADAAEQAEAEAARAAIDEVLRSKSCSCGGQLCLHVSDCDAVSCMRQTRSRSGALPRTRSAKP